jgi:hypothetical protein
LPCDTLLENVSLCEFNSVSRDDGLIIGEYLIFKSVTKEDFATYKCTISNGDKPKVFNVTLIEGGKCAGLLNAFWAIYLFHSTH